MSGRHLSVGVVAAGLRRIDDQQPVRFGQRVHPGPDREVLGGLRAAVQHDDQALQALVRGRGNIQPIAARAGGAWGWAVLCERDPLAS